MRKIEVSPSLLSADFNNLESELKKVESSCNMIHLDVMDGVFVPNISFGLPVIKSIRKSTKLFFDTHLMIIDPFKYVEAFVKAGSDLITFHLECYSKQEQVLATIRKIKSFGVKVGVSIRPNTSVQKIIDLLKIIDIDLVLVMSVEPGFGGQKFIESSLGKIKMLREYIDSKNLSTLIEVDGGIESDISKLVIKAGADVLVSGSYLFVSDDFKKAVENLCQE